MILPIADEPSEGEGAETDDDDGDHRDDDVRQHPSPPYIKYLSRGPCSRHNTRPAYTKRAHARPAVSGLLAYRGSICRASQIVIFQHSLIIRARYHPCQARDRSPVRIHVLASGESSCERKTVSRQCAIIRGVPGWCARPVPAALGSVWMRGRRAMERADVVVVGAGLIGSAVAWRLAQAGLRVVLLDRGEPGQEASWAGAGLLQPEAGREASPELLRLWLESLAMYDDFIRELREATSADVEFRLCGRLVLALDAAEEAALHQRAEAQRAAGIPCEWLTAAEVRRREPAVTPDVRAALYFPQHGLVDNRRLVRILALAAAMAGARVRGYEPVVAIAARGGRVEGVATANGRIAADVVVNAAGCWAGQLLPERWPSLGKEESPSPIIGPAKGEIIALEAQPRPLAHVVSTRDASVSARADGRIVVGATVIHGTFDRQ